MTTNDPTATADTKPVTITVKGVGITVKETVPRLVALQIIAFIDLHKATK